MTRKGKMQELVERLTHKTQDKEISWSKSVPPGSFLTSFPRHSVKIGPSTKAENTPLTLTILDDVGNVAETAIPTSLINRAQHSELQHPELIVASERLDKLYELIEASQSGSTALDELLQELA